MRKHVLILWLLLVLGILIGCKKKPFDYRSKFIGEWKFRVERTDFNTDSIGYYYHDTLIYFGQIKYGNNDDNLLIEYSSNKSITLNIDKENKLSGFPSSYCGGEFLNDDSLHLYLRWGGLGGGTTHQIDGLKK